MQGIRERAAAARGQVKFIDQSPSGFLVRVKLEASDNSDIAGQLYLSEGTVKNHVSSLYGKIGINDRTQAVLYAIRQGLITLDP